MNRRGFLLGTAAAITAPALPKAEGLKIGVDLATGPDKVIITEFTPTPGFVHIHWTAKRFDEAEESDWEQLGAVGYHNIVDCEGSFSGELTNVKHFPENFPTHPDTLIIDDPLEPKK